MLFGGALKAYRTGRVCDRFVSHRIINSSGGVLYTLLLGFASVAPIQKLAEGAACIVHLLAKCTC